MSVTTLVSTNDGSLLNTIRQTADTIRGCRVDAVSSPAAVLEQASRSDVALVICHINSPADVEPVRALVDEFRIHSVPVAMLISSDSYSSSDAIDFLRRGVVDYLPRPMDLRRLKFLMESLTLRARYEFMLQSSPAADSEDPVLADESPVPENHLSVGATIIANSTAAPPPPVDLGQANIGSLSKLAAARVRGEVARICQALDSADNNRSQAARELGVSREAFYKKLRKYGLMNYGH